MRLTKAMKAAVTALEDIKARDITVLDVRKQTALYDALIVATAESARQTKALASNVRDEVVQAGGHIVGSEGEESGEWVLVDCSDFVVHIMQPAVRAYYNLEELWQPPTPTRSAKSTEIAAEKPKAAKKRAVAKATPSAPTPTATTSVRKTPKKVVAKKVASTATAKSVVKAVSDSTVVAKKTTVLAKPATKSLTKLAPKPTTTKPAAKSSTTPSASRRRLRTKS